MSGATGSAVLKYGFGYCLLSMMLLLGGPASVCLLSMMLLLGASRLSSLYLRFVFHLMSGVTGSAVLKYGFIFYRLLRMNVQGCHNILALCLHIEFETVTASGQVHHPSNTFSRFNIRQEISSIP